MGLVSSQFIARLLSPLLNWVLSFPPLPTFATSTVLNHNCLPPPLCPYTSTSSCASTWPYMVETKLLPIWHHLSPTYSSSKAHLFWKGNSKTILTTNVSSTESTNQNNLSLISRRTIHLPWNTIPSFPYISESWLLNKFPAREAETRLWDVLCSVSPVVGKGQMQFLAGWWNTWLGN